MYKDLFIWVDELHLRVIKIIFKNHLKYTENKLRLIHLKE